MLAWAPMGKAVSNGGGTSMGAVEWSPRRKAQEAKRRLRQEVTKAGPVTITRADGTVEERPSYKSREVQRIVARGKRRQ